MYIAACKKIMAQRKRYDLDQQIAANRQGFILNQASFRMALDTYQNHGKWLAREVLHAIFFLPRNDADIPKNIRSRIDFLHQMLGLKNEEALCGDEHPVSKEYPKPGGRAALRFFPKPGSDGQTIANVSAGSQSALFVSALGKSQLVATRLH